SSPPRPEGFKVMIPAGASPLNFEPTTKRTWLGLGPDETEYSVRLPPGTRQEMTSQEAVTIELPEDTELPEPTKDAAGNLVYEFPRKRPIRQPPVPRFRLAWVIALAVAGICLWGTLMGSMLPIIFKRLGVDPGIASSPFVATFVDVTGIIIYFSIARVILAQVLG